MAQASDVAARQISDGGMPRRCPSCGSDQVRRARQKNLVESAVLRLFLLHPFRCESCRQRFYDPMSQPKSPATAPPQETKHAPVELRVLVYGRGQNEEPFHEETSLRMGSAYAGVITLTRSVEVGQKLVLIRPGTEEDQPCRVALVGEQRAGQILVGVRFHRPAWEFTGAGQSPHRGAAAGA